MFESVNEQKLCYQLVKLCSLIFVISNVGSELKLFVTANFKYLAHNCWRNFFLIRWWLTDYRRIHNLIGVRFVLSSVLPTSHFSVILFIKVSFFYLSNAILIYYFRMPFLLFPGMRGGINLEKRARHHAVLPTRAMKIQRVEIKEKVVTGIFFLSKFDVYGSIEVSLLPIYFTK